jgi:hypothetical protein
MLVSTLLFILYSQMNKCSFIRELHIDKDYDLNLLSNSIIYFSNGKDDSEMKNFKLVSNLFHKEYNMNNNKLNISQGINFFNLNFSSKYLFKIKNEWTEIIYFKNTGDHLEYQFDYISATSIFNIANQFFSNDSDISKIVNGIDNFQYLTQGLNASFSCIIFEKSSGQDLFLDEMKEIILNKPEILYFHYNNPKNFTFIENLIQSIVRINDKINENYNQIILFNHLYPNHKIIEFKSNQINYTELVKQIDYLTTNPNMEFDTYTISKYNNGIPILVYYYSKNSVSKNDIKTVLSNLKEIETNDKTLKEKLILVGMNYDLRDKKITLREFIKTAKVEEKFLPIIKIHTKVNENHLEYDYPYKKNISKARIMQFILLFTNNKLEPITQQQKYDL